MKIINLMEDTKGKCNLLYEHGLSLYIELDEFSFLFDTGASDKTWDNAKSLGIKLNDIDFVILSHGHYDHSGGISTFNQINNNATIYVKDGYEKAYYHITSEKEKYIGVSEEVKQIKNIRVINDSVRINDFIDIFSDVKQTRCTFSNSKELVVKENEVFVKDDFSHEQNVVIKDNDELILICGCAHNGIVNIMDKFISIYGKEPDYVIGGFHLNKKGAYKAMELTLLKEIGAILNSYNTNYITGHCTGENAYRELKQILRDKIKYMHSGDIVLER